MGKMLRGCLVLVGLAIVAIVVLVAVGNRSQSSPQVSGEPKPSGAQAVTNNKSQMATSGQTVQLGGWEVTLLDFGPYDRFSPGKPAATKSQGVLVVADMRIKNLQNSTSNFTQNDFILKAGDGREFKPAGQTATIDRGFVISQTVQPGLTTENRVVFDIDPAAKDLTFTALKITFSVANQQ